VYWEYVGPVASLIRRALASVGKEAAGRRNGCIDLADVVQDVFIKAFGTRARLAYDGVREYRPLLMTIACNTFVDHLRRRSREVLVDLAALERLGALATTEPEVEAWADRETMGLVESYVQSLPPEQRTVYVQRYVHCRSQTEAAAAIGLSRQQLRTMEGHLHAGLAREIRRAQLRPSTLPPMPLLPSREVSIAARDQKR
jgi:RNA polymerase sigma factor (sigma-70 family)